MDNRGPNLLRAQRRPPCRWQRLVSTARRLSAILFRIVLPMLKSPIFSFFFFIVSNPLSCGRHTSDCSKIFFKRARKPRNKTTRFKFTDIAEYVKKQQYFTLQHHRVMCQFIQASRTNPCFPPVLRQTPTYIDDKNKNYTYIYI